MKIVADENIPLIENYFGAHGALHLKPGRQITNSDLLDADILLVRSVTKVNQALLKNTHVKFVGSVTTGFDHLDIDWLDQAGIKWCVTPGSNAVSVVEYVVCVIASLQKMNFLPQQKYRAAVIGAGNIGKQVIQKLELLGCDVVVCDPFCKDQVTVPIEELADLDFISMHTPLTKTGSFPTYHLIQQTFLQRQKKDCVLLNAGRGEVISFEDLKLYGQHLIWCLDVFENEPFIDVEVMESAVISTPHIAGYSIQSKYRGVEMIYHAAIEQNIISAVSNAEPLYPTTAISFNHSTADWRDVVLKIFDPAAMSQHMKETLLQDANLFDRLRKNFTDRYEFGFVEVKDVKLSEKDRVLLECLGLK
ncbi:MAG: 4-phosphoerythronate dehydrogenase [Gammaproteobacteria bacterium]